MVKDIFKAIAEKENGVFKYKEDQFAMSDGSRSPNLLFSITLDYKHHKIHVLNRTGTTFVGTITLILNSTARPLSFKISTISHLKNLFLRKCNRFKIQSKNKNIKFFIENNVAFNELINISNKVDFSPIITTHLEEHPKKVITKYHLQFDDWTQVIKPIINFYKALADEFDTSNLYLSNNQYKNYLK